MACYSKARTRALLASVDGAPTNDAKGDALEELGKCLLGTVAGVGFPQAEHPRCSESPRTRSGLLE